MSAVIAAAHSSQPIQTSRSIALRIPFVVSGFGIVPNANGNVHVSTLL